MAGARPNKMRSIGGSKSKLKTPPAIKKKLRSLGVTTSGNITKAWWKKRGIRL